MTTNLSPPPIRDDGLSFQVKEWLNKLYDSLGGSSGTIPWDNIDTSGSNIAEIQTRLHSSLQNLSADDHDQYVLANGTRNITGQQILEDNLVLPKTSGKGVLVDAAAPTYGWRDILGAIETRPAGGGGAAALPDYTVYRGSIYQYRFGTIAPNNHLHEAFINFHIPHDYVPGTDLFLHVHWSQIVVDTGGTAGVPGVAKWYFDVTYADGHGTAGGSADPFIAPFTVSVTQQGSTTQYGHMIAEVQITGASLPAANIEVDGLLLVRVYRDPTDVNDTVNQDTFVHFVDIHYQSTNMATKQKAPNFYV